ncbi:unnamed protein product [Adineta ricciae]|uniref:Uncharacterized protein n=1 Tax=Adineta ricciae TaxID=249248 RepID=A0A816A4V6_ADIRI|nr:unnamed protein product [Adineta ricciae]
MLYRACIAKTSKPNMPLNFHTLRSTINKIFWVCQINDAEMTLEDIIASATLSGKQTPDVNYDTIDAMVDVIFQDKHLARLVIDYWDRYWYKIKAITNRTIAPPVVFTTSQFVFRLEPLQFHLFFNFDATQIVNISMTHRSAKEDLKREQTEALNVPIKSHDNLQLQLDNYM